MNVLNVFFLVSIPGFDLKNIFSLRSIEDAHAINAQLNDQSHVVVLGVSFIGMEAAAYCVKKAAKVTVIGRDSVPLRAFGDEIGGRVMQFFEEQNVHFIMKSGIKECSGDETIDSVVLNDGTKLKADILITGVGSTLNTEFLKGSGVNINGNGSIDTNEYLETNVADIYVGGDIANSPLFKTGHRETIGHYGMSQYHGKIAAINMIGNKQQELKAVPFFWMLVFGKSFRYAGHGKPSGVKIDGSLEDLKFIAYFLDGEDKVIAVCTCGRDPLAAQFAEYLASGRTLTKSDIERDPLGWTKPVSP
jgi:NADPH-dependent 2,4-dienoyl-CoA reductase/sulfur reductase-like enzyme